MQQATPPSLCSQLTRSSHPARPQVEESSATALRQLRSELEASEEAVQRLRQELAAREEGEAASSALQVRRCMGRTRHTQGRGAGWWGSG